MGEIKLCYKLHTIFWTARHMVCEFSQKKMTKKVPVLIGSIICCCLLDKVYAIDHSFVEGLDTNLHKIHRSLLQDDTGISSSNELDEASPPPIIEQVEEVTEAPIVYKGLAEPGEPELGPKLFYDGKDFLMKLGGPIRVTIFSGPAKGRLISKCPFEMTVSSKIPTKLLLDFCPDFFCSFLGASWKLFGLPGNSV